MQAMRDLLRSSLARSLRPLAEEDRLAAALPLVCGSALAARCVVEGLVCDQDERRTLRLRVDRGEWMASLLAMRDVLQRDLARTAGVRLDEIIFEAVGAEAVGAGKTYPRGRYGDGRVSANGNPPAAAVTPIGGRAREK